MSKEREREREREVWFLWVSFLFPPLLLSRTRARAGSFFSKLRRYIIVSSHIHTHTHTSHPLSPLLSVSIIISSREALDWSGSTQRDAMMIRTRTRDVRRRLHASAGVSRITRKRMPSQIRHEAAGGLVAPLRASAASGDDTPAAPREDGVVTSAAAASDEDSAPAVAAGGGGGGGSGGRDDGKATAQEPEPEESRPPLVTALTVVGVAVGGAVAASGVSAAASSLAAVVEPPPGTSRVPYLAAALSFAALKLFVPDTVLAVLSAILVGVLSAKFTDSSSAMSDADDDGNGDVEIVESSATAKPQQEASMSSASAAGAAQKKEEKLSCSCCSSKKAASRNDDDATMVVSASTGPMGGIGIGKLTRVAEDFDMKDGSLVSTMDFAVRGGGGKDPIALASVVMPSSGMPGVHARIGDTSADTGMVYEAEPGVASFELVMPTVGVIRSEALDVDITPVVGSNGWPARNWPDPILKTSCRIAADKLPQYLPVPCRSGCINVDADVTNKWSIEASQVLSPPGGAAPATEVEGVTVTDREGDAATSQTRLTLSAGAESGPVVRYEKTFTNGHVLGASMSSPTADLELSYEGSAGRHSFTGKVDAPSRVGELTTTTTLPGEAGDLSLTFSNAGETPLNVSAKWVVSF